MRFSAPLEAFRARHLPSVEAALDRSTSADALPGCPAKLREAMRYSLLTLGKRLRPLLVLLAADACGGDIQTAIPAACALEMVHVFSLIHDDLPAMDDDDLRRGKPTNHKVFGEANAILAGDALLALAFDILTRDGGSHEAAFVSLLAAAAGASGICGGQADDLAGEKNVASVAQRKTAALFGTAAELGAVSVGASDLLRDALKKFGTSVGLAFQINDDLADADEEQDKPTFVSIFGREESERRAADLLREALSSLSPFSPHAKLLSDFAEGVLSKE